MCWCQISTGNVPRKCDKPMASFSISVMLRNVQATTVVPFVPCWCSITLVLFLPHRVASEMLCHCESQGNYCRLDSDLVSIADQTHACRWNLRSFVLPINLYQISFSSWVCLWTLDKSQYQMYFNWYGALFSSSLTAVNYVFPVVLVRLIPRGPPNLLQHPLNEPLLYCLRHKKQRSLSLPYWISKSSSLFLTLNGWEDWPHVYIDFTNVIHHYMKMSLRSKWITHLCPGAGREVGVLWKGTP